MSNPNDCATCRHKQFPDEGHCYMFRLAPTGPCAQHTIRVESLRDMKMQFGQRVLAEVQRRHAT